MASIREHVFDDAPTQSVPVHGVDPPLFASKIMNKSLLLLLALIVPSVTQAQLGPPPPQAPRAFANPAADPREATVDRGDSREIPPGAAAEQPAQHFRLALRWSDSTAPGSISVENPTQRPLRVHGVQSSGNIFIASFPEVIPAGGSREIQFIFDAKPGSTSDGDVIRLKTDQGEKTLLVQHDREKVVTLDHERLRWELGEDPVAKSVLLQVPNGEVKPTRVRPTAGADATLEHLGGPTYRISVTPRSTAKAASFPVFIDFAPDLPGATPVISVVIDSSN